MSDYERYQELVAMLKCSIRDASSIESRSAIWKRIEAIKNRHGGHVPPKDKQEPNHEQ